MSVPPRPGDDSTLPLLWIALPAAAFALLAVLVAVSDSNAAWFIAGNAAARDWLPAAVWAGITNFGSTLGAFALAAPTLAWRPRWAASMLLAAPAAGLYAQGLKHLFAIPRPAAVLTPEQIHVIGVPLQANSFPSGHTVAAFVLAGVAVLCASECQRRRFGWLALGAAALVAFSRIAVGAHWPLDLFAGAAGGWLCAAIGVRWAQRWRFWEQPNGIRAMAALLITAAVLLAFEDLGYPQGQWAQYLLAVWGLGGAAFALSRQRAGHRPAHGGGA